MEAQLVSDRRQCVNSFDSIVFMNKDSTFRLMNGSSKYNAGFDEYNYRIKPKKEVKKKKPPTSTGTTARDYVVNKKKLRAKIYAFYSLVPSRKFSAFYSISFPKGFPDKSAGRVLNNVLTSLRKDRLRFQYIWVAERQKNGTIHFHILVNQFFNIRVTNYLFAQAIENEIQKESLYDLNFNKDKYNGCDVIYVRNEKGLRGYLTKYVSKNEDNFEVRPWACCRVVSSLFVSISCIAGEVDWVERLIQQRPDNSYIIFSCDFATYIPLNKMNNSYLMRTLKNINNQILKSYEYNNEDRTQMEVIDNIDHYGHNTQYSFASIFDNLPKVYWES